MSFAIQPHSSTTPSNATQSTGAPALAPTGASSQATQPSTPSSSSSSSNGATPKATTNAESALVAATARASAADTSIEAASSVGEMPQSTEDIEHSIQEKLRALAGDEHRFNEALQLTFGKSYDANTAYYLRKALAEGDFDALPKLEAIDPAASSRNRVGYDAESRTLRVDATELASAPAEVERAYATQVFASLSNRLHVDAKPAVGGGQELFERYLDPTVDPKLELYRAQPPADETAPPVGLEPFAYGTGDVPLVQLEDPPENIAGAVGTPPEVAEIAKAGAANFTSPEWMQLVAKAVAANGGLGDSEYGFLAYSENYGFVRLRDLGLTPEQNRQMAAMSLQMGWSIEDLPTRRSENGLVDPKANAKIVAFVDEYAQAFQAWVQDPKANAIKLKDGKRRYVLELNEKAERFVSYSFKKQGGLRGWVQDHMQGIAKVLGPIANFGWVIPAYGWIASAAARTLQTGAGWIATGKLKAQQVVSTVAGWFMPAGTQASASTVAGFAAANAAAEVIDTGKLSAHSVVGVIKPMLGDLPGDVVIDHAVRQGLDVLAGVIDTGKLSARDLYSALAPLVFELPNGPAKQQLAKLAQLIDGGRLSAADALAQVKPLIDSVTGDPRTDGLLRDAFGVLAGAIDDGTFSAEEVLQAAANYVGDRLNGIPGHESIYDMLEIATHYYDTGKFDSQAGKEFFADLTGVTLLELRARIFGRREKRAA
jgi:hypothetical protein